MPDNETPNVQPVEQPLELELGEPYIGSPFSPEVEISETNAEVTVTITDARGDHSYTIEKPAFDETTVEYDLGTGTPSVEVTASGTVGARDLNFNFRNMGGFTAEPIAEAQAATRSANAAAELANTKAGLANDAATNANNKATEASNAASAANTATTNANNATTAANNAASSATNAATNANTKAGLANDAATNANTKAGLANDAAALANQKAGLANDAATLANTKAGLADDAATNANNKATAANDAATLATTKAGLANDAATLANTKAELADTKAGLADTAATAANTAAEAANAAAEAVAEYTEGYFPNQATGASDAIQSTEAADQTYLYRASGTDHDGVARIECVKGHTVKWNQIAWHGNFPDNDTEWTATGSSTTSKSISGNEITITNDSGVEACGIVNSSTVITSRLIDGHVYILSYEAKTSASIDIGASLGRETLSINPVVPISSGATTTSYRRFSGICTFTSTTYAGIRIVGRNADAAVGQTLTVRNVMLFDLTAIFGAGNEPTTVAEFEALYPEAYYAYDAGSLLSVNMLGIQTEDANGDLLDTREIDTSEYFPTGEKSAGTAHDALYADHYDTVIASIDLSQQTWSWQSSWKAWFTDYVLPLNHPSTQTVKCNVKHATLDALSYDDCIGGDESVLGVGAVWNDVVSPNSRIVVRNGSTTTQPTGMLYYELATPVETPIDPPLNMSYRVEAGGTERVIVDTTQPAPQSAPPILSTAYGYTAESLRDAALSTIANVENFKASTNYAIGSYLMHGGKLYKVTSAIASGESITPGTNCTQTTVMAELIALTS